MTLHSKNIANGYLKEALRLRSIKRLLHVIYILFNGYLLKYFGFVIPFINGRIESWQDTSAMKSLLIRNGFKVDVHNVGWHTVIQGTLSEKKS